LGLDVTEGHLLGGAVPYAQPVDGYRTGIEPIFMAAAIPARPGDRVLEAGTGAGAGLLCLSRRVPGITGVGIEIEPAMAAIATINFGRNDPSHLSVRTGDILAQPATDTPFDHAMANPPWHDAAGSLPEDALRHRAKMAEPGLATQWIAAMARLLRPRGTLTLVVPPRALPETLAALAVAGCGAGVLFPLWPRAGRESRILLIQAIHGARGDFRMLPGLILHEDAHYTDAAEAVLRQGDSLALR
jgi:tRNA1Val (adenine37-N6)-methyltransferase